MATTRISHRVCLLRYVPFRNDIGRSDGPGLLDVLLLTGSVFVNVFRILIVGAARLLASILQTSHGAARLLASESVRCGKVRQSTQGGSYRALKPSLPEYNWIRDETKTNSP